jgi:hypothetical protein
MTQPPTRRPASDVVSTQVFISHATRDRVWVDRVAKQVVAMGIHPYLAEHDPQLGRLLSDKVQEEISHSAAMLVLLTEAGHDSNYVHQEIGYALANGVLVIALVAPEIDRTTLGMLGGIEYLPFDFDDPKDAIAPLTQALLRIATEQAPSRAVAAKPIADPLLTLRAEAQLTYQLDLQFTSTDLLIGGFLVVAVVALMVVVLKES